MVAERDERETLSNIEGLRIISSCGILFDHFLPYPLHYEPLGNHLGIFVDLFFVISGIVIASAYGSRVSTPAEYGLFIQRRLARLYPLHLATMGVYIIIALAAAAGFFHVNNAARYEWSALIPYLTLTQSWGLNGVIAWNRDTWSISAEMLVYLLVPLLLIPMRWAPRPALLLVAVLSVFCAVGSAEYASRPFTLLVTQVTQLRVLPSFAFGLWLATHKEWLLSRVPAGAAITGFWIGTLGLVLCLGVGAYAYLMLGCVWLLVGSAYYCDLKAFTTVVGWKPISDQGRLTYSIYLIHPIIGTLWLEALGKHLLNHVPGGPWIAVAIGILLVFALSILSYTYFEEPLRKRLGRPLVRTRDARPGALA